VTRDACGRPLVPGWNADKVDVAAGLAAAARFGYGQAEHQMVAEYALMRHRRGEEDGAEKSALGGGIDLTSWRVILAHAMAAAEQPEPALTCVYCRRAPATHLLVADLTAGRVAHLVCGRCGTRNVGDAGKIAEAPSSAWLFTLTPAGRTE
jgi:hypothetical protein